MIVVVSQSQLSPFAVFGTLPDCRSNPDSVRVSETRFSPFSTGFGAIIMCESLPSLSEFETKGAVFGRSGVAESRRTVRVAENAGRESFLCFLIFQKRRWICSTFCQSRWDCAGRQE